MQNIPPRQANSNPPGLNRIAAIALILANLVIVAWTLKDQWGFLQILYLFWFEAIVIGAYNLLKMFVVFVWGNPFGSWLGRWVGFESPLAAVFYGLMAMIFFVVKFGGFTLAMGFALLILPAWLQQPETGQQAGNSDQLVLVAKAFKAASRGLPVSLAALVVSHGISFVVNFLRRREYERASILVLVFWPYARMALVLAVLVVAGLAAGISPPLGRTTIFAVMVVLLKLLADLASHAFEHTRKPTVPPRDNRFEPETG